jgi:hypothetical protein
MTFQENINPKMWLIIAIIGEEKIPWGENKLIEMSSGLLSVKDRINQIEKKQN